MNKKLKIALLSLIAILIFTLTTTYAFWYVTKYQTNENVIASKCINISLTNEENDIQLLDQYPITDEEGMKLIPYTFTVTNNCDTSIDYQINLESVEDIETSVSSSSIKVSLNNSKPALLKSKLKTNIYIENSFESRRLYLGSLKGKQSEDYNLKLWIDENAPITDSNKKFKGKINVVAGQGINYSIKENTLAAEIINSYNGLASINVLNPDFREISLESAEEVNLYLPSNKSYYWGTDYEWDSTDGKYVLAGEIVQANLNECKNRIKECGLYTFGQTSNSNYKSQNLYIRTSYQNEQGDNYISAKLLKPKNDYSQIINESEYGIYISNDDYGESYYFRGDVKDNYVKFGKWAENSKVRGYFSLVGPNYYKEYEYKEFNTLEECESSTNYNKNCQYAYQKGEDMYWRIVRINGDGTIRMIYDGTKPVSNGTEHISTITYTRFNTLAYDISYKNSLLKIIMDEWYNNNLKTNYGLYISDSIFCQDTKFGYSEVNGYHYAGYDRIINNAPKLTCAQEADKYTVSIDNGNGYITNPVGLITADEVLMSGGIQADSQTQNTNYYLYSGESFYTLTPANVFYDDRYMWTINKTGVLRRVNGRINFVDVRPVINLKADVEFTGDGTKDNPYAIITE